MRRPWWVLPLALALAWLVSLAPAMQRASQALFDAQLQLAWPDTPRDDVVVVDIDEASIRALQLQLGRWPYRGDAMALLTEYLFEQGARAVVLDIPLALDGDATQLAGTLRASARVVLAAHAADSDAAGGGRGAPASQAHGRVLPAHWPRGSAPAFDAPAEALLATGTAVGVVAPFDGDGVLRRWTMLHEVQGHALPALPLATLQALQRDAPLRYADGRLRLGEHDWPVDAQGRVLAKLAPREAIPSVGFMRVGAAALGITEDGALRKRFAGRVVFVGSSAWAARDARGARPDTTASAAATSALAAGQVLAAPSHTLDFLWIAIAVLPAIALWRRGRHDVELDTLQALAACGAVLLASTLLLAASGLPSRALPALTLSAAVWLLACCAAHFERRTDDQADPGAAGLQF